MNKIVLHICFLLCFFVGKAQQNMLLMQKGSSLVLKDSSLLYIQGSFVADSLGKGLAPKLSLDSKAHFVLGTSSNQTSDWLNFQKQQLFVEGTGTVWLAAGHNQKIGGTVKNQHNTSFQNLYLADKYPLDGNIVTQKSLFDKNNNIEIRGVLNLNNEHFNTFENEIWVSNPDTNAILRTGSLKPPFENSTQLGMVSSTGVGRLIRATQMERNYFYPTGQMTSKVTEGFYPVILKPKGNTFNFYGIKTVVSNPLVDIGDKMEVELDTVSRMFYQQVNHFAGSERCDLQLFYNNSFDLNLTADSINTIAQWNDTKGWSNMGTIKMGKPAFSTTLGFNSTISNKLELPSVKGLSNENVTVAKLNNRKAKADFMADKTKGCSPLTVTFTNKSINYLAWHWKFPGGKPDTSTLLNPVVTYDKPGVYPVYLYVSNAIGQDSLAKVDYITVLGPPIPNFTYTIISKDKVEIQNLTKDADQVSWIINGKPYYTKDQNFTIELEQSGLQSIKLIARNVCGTSELVKTFNQDLSIACNEMNPQFRPNPSADVSYLVFNGEPENDLPFMVCTEDGKILQRGTIKAKQKKIEFDMTELPSAMYLVIIDCNGSLIVRKVIKQWY